MKSSDPIPAESTHVAVLTPAGRGAVATLGVRGPRAIEIVAQRFVAVSGKPLTGFAAGSVVFGRLHRAAGAAEELVVGIANPYEVEVHCHGGIAAAEAVAAALVAAGAVRIDGWEWAAIHESNRIAAEAAIALTQARTERTAAILLDQYRGALAAAIERGEELDSILARVDLGRHLTLAWRVVLCGPPNVGKSSLINALVGYARAIVHTQPGTTRDVLLATAAFDGWPVELADTAGLREGQSLIETEGVARARDAVAAADVLLLVCDATSPWTTADRELWQEVLALAQRDGSRLVVHNKCDLALPPSDGRPEGIAVSALTGMGLEDVEHAIAAALVPSPPLAGAAVPFTERQIALLQAAQDAAQQGDEAAARELLATIRR
jgi:tRNA modification GTPase